MNTIRTNERRLVMQSVIGEVASPRFRTPPYRVSTEGVPMVLPGTGGVTYNVRVGDPAFGWVADHVEPAVSARNRESKDGFGPENEGFNYLSCVGNDALVVTGAAKGAMGFVTGTHGGIEHVLIDFDPKTLGRMTIGDRIQVRAFGQGLALADQPEVKLFNLDPRLFHKLGCRLDGRGRLHVPVTRRIPPELMGSGVGSSSAYSGDYDITSADKRLLIELGIDRLRLGDLVAIEDHDNSFGRAYRRGAVTVGVVIHSDCVLAGHGPGVTAIMTSVRGNIVPEIHAKANIANYLGVRRDIFGVASKTRRMSP